MNIKGIVFDLGGTLLQFHPPQGDWEAMEKAGGKALIRLLEAEGYILPSDALEQIWQTMQSAWLSIHQQPDPHTLILAYQLENLLNIKWGLNLSIIQLKTVEHAFLSGSQAYVRPFPDTLYTLQTLKQRNFPIGLISNTLWPGITHEYDLKFLGLRDYFDLTLFSSDELAWKPYPEIFHRAAHQMKLDPSELVYIGDNLLFDIYGGQKAGYKTILINSNDKPVPAHPELGNIMPDYCVTQVSDILVLLKKDNS